MTAPTCPYCGGSNIQELAPFNGSFWECMDDTFGWDESSRQIKRIRALEADLKAVVEEVKSFENELARAHAECEDLEANNARLAAEVERLKGRSAFSYEAEIMTQLSEALGHGGQECDVFAEIESLRSRLAAAEKQTTIFRQQADELRQIIRQINVALGDTNRTPFEDIELLNARLAAAEARVKGLEPVVNDLRKIRDLVETLDADVFGEGSTTVTAQDGEPGLMTWPIRDEVANKLNEWIIRIDPDQTQEVG